eukprot:1472405-Pleurochrysis_carterae.AAC.3
MIVTSVNGDVAHRDARARFSVHAGDSVSARAHIDEVADVWMDVISTSAVDDEANMSLTIVSTGLVYAGRCAARPAWKGGHADAQRCGGLRSCAGDASWLSASTAIICACGRTEWSPCWRACMGTRGLGAMLRRRAAGIGLPAAGRTRTLRAPPALRTGRKRGGYRIAGGWIHRRTSGHMQGFMDAV